MVQPNSRQLHEAVTFLGLRAQATAVGMITIAVELRRAGALDDAAIDRIKDAIFNDLALSCPRSQSRAAFEATLRHRIDALFAGQERVGDAETSPLS